MAKTEDFKNIDVKHPLDKPRVQQFTIRRMYESDPDISHLTDHCAGDEYTEQDNERIDAFNRGDWYMLGIRAECHYLMDAGGMDSGGNRSAIIQKLTSGGIWSIESDSGAEYLAEQEQEQIAELKGYCDALGIEYDDKTHIERINE